MLADAGSTPAISTKQRYRADRHRLLALYFGRLLGSRRD